MKKMQLGSLMFLLAIITLCHCVPPQQYRPTVDVNLTQNLEKLTYSHNQRLLVGFNNEAQGEFLVFDGLKLNDMKIISIDDQNKQRVSPSTFAFSNNDDLLVVGSKQGGIYGFTITNNTINTKYDFSFVVGSKTSQNWIRAISFSTQNKIVISTKTTLIIIDREQNTGQFVQKISYNFAHTIYALAWSLIEPKKVIVGTMSSLEGEFSLYDMQTNTTTPINKDKTESLAIFPDGKTILKGSVGKNVEVYTYQTGTLPVLVDTLKDTNDTKEIYVSQNGLYFALITNAGQIKAFTVQNSTSFSNLKNQQSLILNEFLPSLSQQGRSSALSPSGGDIIIIPSDGSSTISKFSLCENKYYFNQQTFTCQSCSQNCNTCFNDQICITCNPNKFIYGDECKLCGSKLDGCLTCSSGQMCITCNGDDNWNTEAKDGKCQCKNTFYNDNGQCSTCEVFLDCLNCAGPNNCTLCKDEGNFNTQPQQGLCVCKPSFYLNQTQCTECSQSITDCQLCSQDGTKCTQCQSPDRKPNTQQSQCVCVDYKYEDQQTKKCQFCDPNQNCITCQPQYPHKCLKCDTIKHFQSDAQDGKCICEASYFDNEGKCSLCSEFMLDCQLCDNKDRCVVCKDQKNFDTKPQEGKCVCVQKYILIGEECKLCSEQINGCSICSSQTNCKVCDENAHFDKSPVDGQCKCMSQYWLNDKICQLCNKNIPGCSTCSEDGSKCLTCQDQSRQPSEDGLSCECRPFTYENTTDQTCQPCDSKHSCIQCKPDNDHQCITCDKNGYWNSTPVNGKCQCMDGYNQYDGKCVFCMVPGCTVCPSQTTCEQCSQIKKFQKTPIHNECKCKSGTRLSQNRQQCIDCNLTIVGCKQCSNANNCQLCDLQNHFVIDPTNDICLCDKQWYLKNNKCQSCSQAIDNCLYCSIVNIDIVECNKCQKGYGKTSNNKSCISCNSISYGCINCDQSSKCTACDQQNGFVLNGTKCVCIKGYYLKGEQCTLCSTAISGCNQCDDQNTCTSCNSDDKFVPQPNNQHKCDCIIGWTLDQGKCTQCSIITGCQTCSDIETCTKCDQNGQFQLTQDNKCQCKKGFWIDQTVCKQCNEKIPNCLTCSQDGSTCQQCSDPNRVLNEKKDECICKQFMYQNQQKECEYCDNNRNCKQCIQKDNCTICDIDKKWNYNAIQGKCICQTGYQQYNNQCLLCQINGCQQCHQQNYCYECSTINRFNQQPINGKCQCQQNTHLDNDKCIECGQKLIGCQQCDNLQQCTICNDKNYFVLNQTTKTCQCDQYHYFISPNCIACSYAIDYCSQCKIDDDDTKQCIKCQKGYIIDSENKTHCLNCQQLIIGCYQCSDNKTCTSCNQQGNFQPFQNQCICKKGYFLQSPQCIQCSLPIPGCIECDQYGEKCSLCDQENNFQLNQQREICQCMTGFYLNDHQCDTCSSILSGCKYCLADGTLCFLCEDGFYLNEGQCKKCSTKIAGCTKCSTDGEQCSQCNIDHFTLNTTTLQCDCQQTYFLKDYECKLCSSQLLSCNKCSIDGKQCIQCMGDNFILNNNTKTCQCEPTFYIDENSSCKLCSQSITGCSICNQQGSQCNKCKQQQNFILNNIDNSTCNCIDGFYLNKIQKQCNLCSTKIAGCTKCSQNGQQSFQCNMTNFILNKQKKICQCIDGYFISSNTQCKLCSQSIQYCQLCSSSNINNNKIENIQNNFTPKCLQCQSTFTLNNQSTLCLCQDQNKQIINNQCKQKQPQTNWIFYGAIAGGAIIVIIISIFVYLKIKKSKLVRLDSYNQLDDQQYNQKSTKPQTILTDGSADKIVFKSSVYRLEDQE